ncbi:LPXTG cell wall anchor domain-containing protein [Secundilactobacillus odoratitofui]|nr:LPXTG cell wall anchor domain-containing protein [Secundilactobacillus odoratitofui]
MPKPVTESAPTTGVNETGSLQPGPSTNKLTIGTATSSQQKLPQTSDSQSLWATIGLALMSLLAALGLSGKRRKEDE